MRSGAFVIGMTCFAVVFPALALPADAAGPVFNVNSFSDIVDADDNGICDTIPPSQPHQQPVCTLRAAVMEAWIYWLDHDVLEEVTINLQLGTYDLTILPDVLDKPDTGDLNLYGRVKIVGKGSGGGAGPTSLIRALNNTNVFFVNSSATITFEDLRIDGGRARLSRPDGGGIYNDGGNVTLTRCLVRDNASLAGYHGGGIYTQNGTLVIRESNFRLNAAGYGGAIGSSNSAVTIDRTTMNLNNATSQGGALFAIEGSVNISNSTFSDNYAVHLGGCCYFSDVTAKLNNTTVAINRADGPGAPVGGGIRVIGTTALTLSNSILVNTRENLAYDDLYCSAPATVTSNGHNLILVAGACPITGAFSDASPSFLFFGNNGGMWATRALGAASPAVNAGTPTGCEGPFGEPLTVDERGVKRPIGSACDLGAFEVEPIGDANGDGSVNVSDVLYLINYLFAGGPIPLGRANVNGGDGSVNVSDVLFLINYLFAGGLAPA